MVKQMSNWLNQYLATILAAFTISLISVGLTIFINIRELKIEFQRHLDDCEKRIIIDDETVNYFWEVNGVQNQMIYKIADKTEVDISKQKDKLPRYYIRGVN